MEPALTARRDPLKLPKRLKELVKFTTFIAAHLAAASVVLLGILAFSKIFHYLYGTEEPLLFGWLPLRDLFDVADVAVMVRFIWKAFTEDGEW